MPQPRLVATLLLVWLVTVPSVQAQYAVGAGVSVPAGSWSETTDPGYMVALGYSPWRSTGGAFRLWMQGYYGRNSSDAGTVQLGLAGLGVSFRPLPAATAAAPYLIGAAGYLNRWLAHPGLGVPGAAGGLYAGGGAGISHGRLWLQGRYQVARVAGSSLEFLLVAGGTSF